ncbi:alpha/beta hydrolase [Nocardia huaxiensis]|uniref:Alpha/beta hydrolase n=1 Tax=Nocardia huaxiensis TaxID=2755382 RepID=A0A7D6ZSZ8_9NOCA|nr:alpha/beta hydrolase [Nocardia huaxiensis]
MSTAECVTVEVRSASIRARIAHRVLGTATRPLLPIAVLVAVAKPARLARLLLVPVSTRLDPLAMVLRPARGTRTRPRRFDTFRAEWVWHNDIAGPDDPAGGAIIYSHGGGFIGAGLNTHRRHVARLSRETGLPVLNLDYRQLPHHVTASQADVMTAYRYVLDAGFPPDRVFLAGDSAGGGLSLATALNARDAGLPMPAGVIGISAWVDLNLTAALAEPNAYRDPLLLGHWLAVPGFSFAHNGTFDPHWSAVDREFTGMPPVFLQVGATEALLSDNERIARRCAAAGIECRLQIWECGIHDFQLAADVLPDARVAMREIGLFVHSHTPTR